MDEQLNEPITRAAFHKNKRKKPSPFKKRMKRILIALCALIFIGVIGYGVVFFGGMIVVDNDALELDATTTIETVDGELISKLYKENRTLISLDNVPDHVQNAFISIEDRRFYEHSGVDMKSVMRAIYKNVIARSKAEGASTITQQLAKNLFLYNDKTWGRKAKEVMAAINLERRFSKDEILELYINQMYFGKGVYGIETASQYFFSKSAADLTVAEGAMLAGLAKAPNGYSPTEHPEKAMKRRNVVLQAMENAGVISAETRKAAQEEPLGLQVSEREVDPSTDSYVDLVKKEAAEQHDLSIDELKRGGYRIVANIDKTAQHIAFEQFKNDEYFPGNTSGVEGAFVMMEQATGNIVAAIGGRDYQLGDLNRLTVNRQPGSTIKPIAVYGPALESQQFTPYSIIPDQPIDYNGYKVENANKQYDGAVSLFQALIQSKNAPTVWLLDQIGIDHAKGFLDKMDIPIQDDGLAIALGGLEEGITPVQLVEGYRTFANSGKSVKSHTIDQIYDRDQALIFQTKLSEKAVFSPQVAWDMTEILMETVKSGTATSGQYGKALAGKTGSTQHPLVEGQTKDAWFVGYTPEYVSALWMGYDNSDKDHYLTGGSSFPTQLTKKILTEMDQQKGLASSFTKPEAVSGLARPIILPEITDVKASLEFGGVSFVKGKLSWSGSNDERVVYRIYLDQEGIDKRVGEVEGKTTFVIDNALLKGNKYYVVPYDPLTKLEGKVSESVELSW
jgi:penicillin-binding protein 2A